MEKRQVRGFVYEKRRAAEFDVAGFTKIVRSGGEFYDEVRSDGRWELLREMNPRNKSIFCIASFDKECPKGFYRYTIGIAKDESFIANQVHELYEFHVKETDWIVFSLDFEKYGAFWQSGPFNMIKELGCEFNKKIGIHIDVFGEGYDGHEMEFWMPVK